MTPITFWFDPVSPYAWLAFQRLPQALEGISHAVAYRPVLLGGLLKHWGQLGPAEVPPKRAWVYRHVRWLAQTQGVPLRMPAVHPFNSMPLLRLLLASAPAGGLPNRWAVEAVLRFVWADASVADPTDPDALAGLAQQLAQGPTPLREMQDDVQGDAQGQAQAQAQAQAIKAELRLHTEAAATQGVFGVPTFSVGERLFWGLDALPMLRAALSGDDWFDSGAWDADQAVRYGVPVRKPPR